MVVVAVAGTEMIEGDMGEVQTTEGGRVVIIVEEAGMEVGSHSRSHPVLIRLGAAGLAAEISGSRRDLEEILGHPPRSFSYPYGSRRTFDPRVVAAVRTAGFETAVSTIPGGNQAGTPPYSLRRIAVYQSDDPALVVAKARGGLDWTGSLQEIWLRLFPHHSVRPG